MMRYVGVVEGQGDDEVGVVEGQEDDEVRRCGGGTGR